MSQIEITQDGGILVATIANPPDGFMDAETEAELAGLLDRVEGDDGIRAVVLTGGLPDVFIRHYDVGLLAERARAMSARGMKFEVGQPVPEGTYHVCLRRIREMAVPFIAEINGTAMGGGFELALGCDIRVALDGPYALGLPEINIGLLPGAGGTQLLARLIGEGRALEMIARGRTLSPQEALDWGIVSELVDEDVVAAATAIAREMAGKPTRAFRNIKGLVRGSAARLLEDGLADERTLFCDLMVNPESIERMEAMVAGKRDIRDRD